MDTRKKTLTRVGFSLALVAAVTTLVGYGMSKLLSIVAPNLIAARSFDWMCIITIVSFDLMGTLVMWLMMRRIPKTEGALGHERLRVGEFLIGIPICEGIAVVGAIVGSILQTQVTGSPTSNVDGILGNSVWFWRIATTVVSAPIFEELIFRKLLIDRLAPYGKLLAVIVSGLSFGLIHANLAQFFYAAMLGMFFAYIYIRTGNILYTIAYHMIINSFSSVVTQLLAEGRGKNIELYTDLYALWQLILIILAVMGVILLIVRRKKFRLPEEEGAPAFGRSLGYVFTSIGMWAFLIATAAMFVFSAWQKSQTEPKQVKLTKANREVNEHLDRKVVVRDGVVQDNMSSIPFTISEEGEYIVTFDSMDSDDPAFVTAGCIKTKSGKPVAFWASDKTSSRMKSQYYYKGYYVLELMMTDSSEELQEYSAEYCNDHALPPMEISQFDRLGKDGVYDMKYHFAVYRVN